MTDAKPYPKSAQLQRGTERRRSRFKANRAQWEVLHRTKIGPCRVCMDAASNGRPHSGIELHHVVPRSLGGDDYAANLVPLCRRCHRDVHAKRVGACLSLCRSLTDSEYAYMVERAGEGFPERHYGIVYEGGER